MSAMDDAFGKIGARPETPTFWKLSEIVLRSDGAIEEARTEEAKAKVWRDLMHEAIDELDTVSYVALQRARRITDNVGEMGRLATLWLDGFNVGAHYAQGQLPQAEPRA